MSVASDLRRVLVLGGARSGKSRIAEEIVGSLQSPVVYVATATAGDDEMAQRIRHHRERRPPGWETLEERVHVSARLAAWSGRIQTVLVEDLTLLLSNAFADQTSLGYETFEAAARAETVACNEIETLVNLPFNMVLVSNEVGMGIVPEFPVGRAFRDALGRTNQHAAKLCSVALLVIAGKVLRLENHAGVISEVNQHVW